MRRILDLWVALRGAFMKFSAYRRDRVRCCHISIRTTGLSNCPLLPKSVKARSVKLRYECTQFLVQDTKPSKQLYLHQLVRLHPWLCLLSPTKLSKTSVFSRKLFCQLSLPRPCVVAIKLLCVPSMSFVDHYTNLRYVTKSLILIMHHSMNDTH